jgi:hypothetical protein
LWFHSRSTGYDTVLEQLGSLRWGLPVDNQGEPSAYAAGRASCCRRVLISLRAMDGGSVHVSLQKLVQTGILMHEIADRECGRMHRQASDAS